MGILKSEIKWKAILGILMVIGAIIFNWPLLFGVLYLTWGIEDIESGYAFILENVNRRDNPILYWITVIIWMASGLYVVSETLILKLMYRFYY